MKTMEAKTIKGGGITSAEGFKAAGVACGIKPRGEKDMALVVSDVPAEAAATFTTNLVKAAPVKVSMRHLRNGKMRGVVINSGCANACTGVGGIADAKAMVEHAAKELETKPHEWLICSTGRIGNRLPMPQVRKGIEKAAAKLGAKNGEEAAKAIMTTDTRRKEFAMRFKVDGRKVTIGGMAKGAGMIAPGLATMLSVITTDADLSADQLDAALRHATGTTFDRLDTDGCMSTNDTVLLMASGATGVRPDHREFTVTLTEVCADLARQLQLDAEGAQKMIAIEVIGAASENDAVTVVRAIARNDLVKCAIGGEDPNWGRILAAVGTTDAVFEPDRLNVAVNGVWVCRQGAAGDERAKVDLTPKDVTITVDLSAGPQSAVILTTDLTAAYVHENSAYST